MSRVSREALESNPAWHATIQTKNGGILCVLVVGKEGTYKVFPAYKQGDVNTQYLEYDKKYIESRISEGRYRLVKGELP